MKNRTTPLERKTEGKGRRTRLIPGKRIPVEFAGEFFGIAPKLEEGSPGGRGGGSGILGALNKVAFTSSGEPRSAVQRSAAQKRGRRCPVRNCHAEFSAEEWNFARFLSLKEGEELNSEGAKPWFHRPLIVKLDRRIKEAEDRIEDFTDFFTVNRNFR